MSLLRVARRVSDDARSAILGAGHYVPTKVVTNDDLAKLMPTSDEWIQQRTGIKERRFIEHDGIGASDLAVPAAQDGARARGQTAKDVDVIIFATLSPDHNFPGSGVLLQRQARPPAACPRSTSATSARASSTP